MGVLKNAPKFALYAFSPPDNSVDVGPSSYIECNEDANFQNFDYEEEIAVMWPQKVTRNQRQLKKKCAAFVLLFHGKVHVT